MEVFIHIVGKKYFFADFTFYILLPQYHKL